MEGRQCEFNQTEVTIALDETLAASITETTLARNSQPQVKRSIGGGLAISRGIMVPFRCVKISITYFKDRLVHNVLTRSKSGSVQAFSFHSHTKCTYGTPNFSSLMRFGTVSTTCSFIDSRAAIADCRWVVAIDRGSKEESCDEIAAAWMRSGNK